MKIRVKADGHNINLWLPTSLLKSRLAYGIIKSSVKRNAKKQQKDDQNSNAELNETATNCIEVDQGDQIAMRTENVGANLQNAEDTCLQASDECNQAVDNRQDVETEQPTQPQSKPDGQFPITHKQVVALYKVLNKCIKANGHFNLVEVESHDGEKVIIRL